jgi:hypothetical protein
MIRYGPGENFLENILYAIANVLEDASDVVSNWTDKIMDSTFKV